jgi:hypothetical protein
MYSRTYKKYDLKMNIFILKNKVYLYKTKKYRWIKIISSKLKYKQNIFFKKNLYLKKACKTREQKEKGCEIKINS